MTESMNKECLHNTFEIMKAPIAQSIRLDWVNNTFTLVTKVLVYWKEIEDWVDNQRTQVFPEEESTVMNLYP